MANTIASPIEWANHSATKTANTSNGGLNNVLAFFDSQVKNRTGWFLLSLMVQGIFFLPIPTVLTYYFGAPSYMVIITLGLFFASVIAGMGGAGIRVLLSIFAISALVHLLLLAVFAI